MSPGRHKIRIGKRQSDPWGLGGRQGGQSDEVWEGMVVLEVREMAGEEWEDEER